MPPALYSTEILSENGIPVVAVEFGSLSEDQKYVSGSIARRRFASGFAKYIPNKLRPLFIDLGMVFKLVFYFLMEGRPRLIIAEGLHEQTIARTVSVFLRIPYVVHVHEIYDSSDLKGLNRLLLMLEGWALRAADFLIFPERTRSELYANRYCLRNPIHIVPNAARFRAKGKGLDLRECYDLPKDAFLIGYLGGIGPENAILEAIRALVHIPNVHFLIWGWGNESYIEALKSLAVDLGVGDRVKFLGVLYEDKWEHLEGCDVCYSVYIPKLLRLKYSATASNKLMEALACGLPVLTSGEKDYREIVEKYDVGICTEGFDIEAIGVAIKGLSSDDLARKRKALNARKLHEDCFNYEAQFIEVLGKCFEYGFTPRKPDQDTPSVSIPR